MINVLTGAFTKYLSTPFEDFTASYIRARGLFMLIDEYDKEDYEELKIIEKWTSQDLKVSLYKLDRVINPTKGEIDEVDTIFEFYRDVKDSEKKTVKLTEREIQDYLCIAIRRVHELVMRNMKPYKLEMRIDGGTQEASAVMDYVTSETK